jgi:uncharacterized RDD family membrane protein YckC
VVAARSDTSELVLKSDEIAVDYLMNDNSVESSGDPQDTKQTSRLIAFPGVSHAVLPPWRQEISKRVREAQEKKARDTALTCEVAEKADHQLAAATAMPLELLPQNELPEVNPIVVAALRRIERAHQTPVTQPRQVTFERAAPAMARTRNDFEYQPTREYQTGNSAPTQTPTLDRALSNNQSSSSAPVTRASAAVAPILENEEFPIPEAAPAAGPDRTHNLVMVQSPVVAQTEPTTEPAKPKPRRVIADNDPVLSYLDSVATSAEIEMPPVIRSPVFSRLAAGVVDLLVVVFLCLPFAAIIEFQNGNWHDRRIAGAMAGIAVTVMFIYLTVSTAMTGRTFGMRPFSLRAIDIKTGLIPTGKQSASRALLCILSFATLGIGFCYALVNDERRAAHDRLSRTAVVRI